MIASLGSQAFPASVSLRADKTLKSRGPGLSRKFWSAEYFGPRTKIFGKIGPGGQYFSEKIGPYPKILVRHTSTGSAVLAVPSRCIHRVYLPVGRQCSAVRGPAVFLYV